MARLARRHTGWFTRWRYEILLAAMLGCSCSGWGRISFYDSWWAAKADAVFGLEFYRVGRLLAVAVVFVVAMGVLQPAASRAARQIGQVAAGWQDASLAAGLFAGIEGECRRIERFRRELEAIRLEVGRLRCRLASKEGA